jgi:hypothetical protein
MTVPAEINVSTVARRKSARRGRRIIIRLCLQQLAQRGAAIRAAMAVAVEDDKIAFL